MRFHTEHGWPHGWLNAKHRRCNWRHNAKHRWCYGWNDAKHRRTYWWFDTEHRYIHGRLDGLYAECRNNHGWVNPEHGHNTGQLVHNGRRHNTGNDNRHNDGLDHGHGRNIDHNRWLVYLDGRLFDQHGWIVHKRRKLLLGRRLV